MNQKGFAPIFLVIIGLLLVVGYTVGNFTATHSVTITKNGSNPTPLPTPSSSPKTTKSQQTPFTFLTNLIKPSVAPASTSSPAPIQSPTSQPQAQAQAQTQATNQPVAAPTPNQTITATGGYNYAGQNLSYTFTFPRDGGDVTGNVEGFCSGPVHGRYDGGEGGNVSGQIPVTCQMGFIKQNYLIDYNGRVYLKDKRVDVDWTGNIPFSPDSKSFSLYF